jgi:hypothetical protein
MSFERRIILLCAKTNLFFGNSFELSRNKFSSVSEWTTFSESCVLFPFRPAGSVMGDAQNTEQAHLYDNISPLRTERNQTPEFSICYYCHHSVGSDMDNPIYCT